MRCSTERRGSVIGNSPPGRAVQNRWPFESATWLCWLVLLTVTSKNAVQPFHVKHFAAAVQPLRFT